METIVMTALLMTTTLTQSHPEASEMTVVTASNCACTWSGEMDYWSSGEIGITLTETTTVHISTCGSEQSTTITAYEYFNDHPYYVYSSSSATCTESTHYWNQYETEELEAGHYVIKVEGYSHGASCAQLTVELDGCTLPATDGTCDGEDDLQNAHPDSSEMTVVTAFNCEYTWSGDADYYTSGDIGITLTETTWVHISTCGSEQSTNTIIFEYWNDVPYYMAELSNPTCTDSTYYWNQDETVQLQPGHYLVKVEGYSYDALCTQLTVEFDGCTLPATHGTCNGEDDYDDLQTAHPDSSEMPVVTVSDCAYTWSGDVDYHTSGDIGITLTETTTVHISTCGSEQSTTFSVYEYSNDHPYYVYSASDGTCSDSYYYWNQDETAELDAGHYVIKVEGYSYGAECAQLTVELDGCSFDAADGTCDGEDDLQTAHPDSSEMTVVTASDCEYTWSGDVDIWSSGDIGITLTETTTVHISTCGSEQSTTISVYEYSNGVPYQVYSSSTGSCTDSTYYWTQDETVKLDAGHYLVKVEGYSYGAECVQLTVQLDGCIMDGPATDGTCDGEGDYADLETAVRALGTIIIVIIVVAVLLCIVTPIAICFCCGICCFAAGKKSNQPVAEVQMVPQVQMMQGSLQPMNIASEGQPII